jgi:hypothetical protein
MQSTKPNAVTVRVKAHASPLGFPFFAWSALLGGDHVDIARDKGHLLAPAFGALQFQRFVLGDGLRAFKRLSAFVAAILVGRHWTQTQKMRAAVENDQFMAGDYFGEDARLKRALLGTSLTTSSAL